jgi:hypothetical protein
MWEIYTYGGGESLVYIFNAVAAIMGQDEYSTLIRIAGMLGLIFVLFAGAFHQKPINFQWLFYFVFIYMVLFVNKTSVNVVDRLQPANSGIVANVPFGLAAFSSIISTVGDGLSRRFDQFFAQPGDLSYTQTGVLLGSRLFMDINNNMKIKADMDMNMKNFIQNCIFYEVYNGNLSWSQLASSSDIWALMGLNLNPARSTPIQWEGSNPTILTCDAAYNEIGSKLNVTTSNILDKFGMNIFKENNPVTANALITAALPTAYNYYTGLGSTAPEIIQQQLLINQISQSATQAASQAGSPAQLINFSTAQGDVQRKQLYVQLGIGAAKMLPLFKNVLEAFLYGLFPIVFLVFLLPMGVKTLGMYFKALLALQMWTMLYAVLTLIMTVYGRSSTGPEIYDPSMAANLFNINTYNGVELVHAEMTMLAGYISISIPMFAWSLISGGQFAFSQLTSQLMQPTQTAATKAAEVGTTGNISLANSNINTHSYNNLSANKMNTRPESMTHGNTRDTATGATYTNDDAGNRIAVTVPKSSIGLETKGRASEISNINRQLSEVNSQIESESARYSKNLNAMIDKAGGIEVVGNIAERSGLRSTKAYKEAYDITERYVNQGSITRDEQKQIMDRVSGGLSLNSSGGMTLGDGFKTSSNRNGGQGNTTNSIGSQKRGQGGLNAGYQGAETVSTSVGYRMATDEIQSTLKKTDFDSSDDMTDELSTEMARRGNYRLANTFKEMQGVEDGLSALHQKQRTLNESKSHLISKAIDEGVDAAFLIAIKQDITDSQIDELIGLSRSDPDAAFQKIREYAGIEDLNYGQNRAYSNQLNTVEANVYDGGVAGQLNHDHAVAAKNVHEKESELQHLFSKLDSKILTQSEERALKINILERAPQDELKRIINEDPAYQAKYYYNENNNGEQQFDINYEAIADSKLAWAKIEMKLQQSKHTNALAIDKEHADEETKMPSVKGKPLSH